MLKFFTERDKNVISVKTIYFQFMSINSSELTITSIFLLTYYLLLLMTKKLKKKQKLDLQNKLSPSEA